MANYSNLKAAIADVIKTNGTKAITGQVLQDTLNSIVSVIGANYQFAGVATPATNPGTPDQNVFYVAMQGGTYTNFNATALPDGISLLMWNGSWSSQVISYNDGGVFDISVYKSTGGTLATFADLAAALGTNGANVPVAARKGGMSVRFVQSSDNNYVQYIYTGSDVTTASIFTNPVYWQKVNNPSILGYKEKEWEEISLSIGTVITGQSLAGGGISFNTGTNRECVKVKIPIYGVDAVRKIRITANTNANATFGFYRLVIGNELLYLAENETGLRVIPPNKTEIFDIPQNTRYIIINTHDTTTSLSPAKIEWQKESIRGGTVFNNLTLYEKNSRIVDFTNVQFFNGDTIFDNKDVKTGDTVSVSMDIDSTTSITYDYCYIEFYDVFGNSISYFGDGSETTPTQSHYSTEFVVPNNFSHAVLGTSLQGGCVVSAHSNRLSKFGDDINSIDNKIGGDYVYSDYTEVDLSECNSFINCFISDSPTRNTHKSWSIEVYDTNRVWKIVPVPSNARYMRIVSQHVNATIFLHSLDTPVNGLMPDFADVEKKVYNFKNDDICLPSGTNYVVLQTHNTTEDISPDYVGFAETRPSVIAALDESLDGYQVGNEIESVSCPNAAEVVMSTEDNDATQYDNELLGYFSILKVSDELYYMYYSCWGIGETVVTDSSQHLAFAYSTDGLNWVRSIPSGITSPIAGTNLLFEHNVIGAQVFKVMDNEYPYRMVASLQPDPTSRQRPTQTVLYKSADGVNFTIVKVIFPFYCDNQPSCIVRGNIIKMYVRWRTGDIEAASSDRYIGVCTIDINGNIIAPPTTFFGLNLYQASASILDERREIAFPTRYLPPPFDTQTIQCFIIDGKEIIRKDFDTSNLIDNDELSYYVTPGLVNIGGDMYLYLSTRNYSHNGGDSVANKICRIKRVKVQFTTTGTWWVHE